LLLINVAVILLHQQVEKVVGIEMCPDAVKDAKHNAELNGKYST
jgi:tRNA/tmRNA/rRNA uracil-C5-methylase (TrmA/RlmC/RlmD family)